MTPITLDKDTLTRLMCQQNIGGEMVRMIVNQAVAAVPAQEEEVACRGAIVRDAALTQAVEGQG
ncbi:hypothetical protein [Xylophilus sp. GOD-11R]|uniref:hypothetical protein n=1 Tax=Xylophilus sp. GOD-11R TaxID=3089814 RepID=UPI00298C49D3|nr:hypothetical protein [Xylophilus sp. GOD-11R]WPB58603.1 hypothetical protein R9X41_08200 [Xylophilus sp. GOD-11R]